VANNNYPQITSVTSESLQAQIRTLLPSQEGFGTDLMAQNVIVPIIDLTSAAEGSTTPQNLQTALAFGSQTAFEVNNGSVVVANTPGFYRVVGILTSLSYASAPDGGFEMSDGLSTKKVWGYYLNQSNSNTSITSVSFDLTFFLASGQSLSAVCATPTGIRGSSRQIADVNGTLINPSGFTPQ
jgi:hypothetical protein